MDFLALPRRDLQALCKRNGVRANMTNAAMADALRALPTVDGIEEYVKPVVVPEPAVTAVEEEEKLNPHGCRASAKSSEPIKQDGGTEDEKGNAKRPSNKDEAPALGVGRRGASRRSRPVPVVPQPAGKVAAAEGQNSLAEGDDNVGAGEEQGNPVLRGRSVAVKASEAITLDRCEEANSDDVPDLGVRRRGATRCAPDVVPPPGKLAAQEQRAPIHRGRRVKNKPTESTRLDDNDEDEREDGKPEDKPEDAPVFRESQRRGSRRARAALAVSALAGKVEEEQKAPIPCAKAKPIEVIRLDDSEEEKENTKPVEEDAPAIGVRRRSPAQAAASNNEARDWSMEAIPVRTTRQRKPTMKALAAAAAAAQKAPRRVTRRDTVRKTILQQEEPQEAVSAPVSDQGCDGPKDLEESCPQKEELNEVAESPMQEGEDVIIEEEKLMEENTAEEQLVTDQECKDKSTLQEQQVQIKKCDAHLDNLEDSPILGLVFTTTGQPAGDDEVARFQDGEGSGKDQLGTGVCEEIRGVDEEMEMAPVVQVLQASLTAEESNEEVIASGINHKIEKEKSKVGTEDELVCQEKEDMDIDQLQADLVDDEAINLDCSGNISLVDGEETNELTTENGVGCQEKGDVLVDKVVPDTADEVNILEVEEMAGDIISEKCYISENPVAMDKDGQETTFHTNICDGVKLNDVVVCDSISRIMVTDSEAIKEKVALITDETPQGAAAMHGSIEDDQFEPAFVHADQVKMTDVGNNLPEVKMTYSEIVEEENTTLVADEKQQNTATMDDDVVDGHFENDVVCANEQMQVATTKEVPELTGTDGEVIVEKKALIVDEKQQSTITIDRDVADDHFKNDVVDSDEQKEETSADSEVDQGKNGTVIIEDVLNIAHTMGDCVMGNHFGLHSKYKKAITDIVPELSRTEYDCLKDNAFTSDVPKEFDVAKDSKGHISPASLGVMESLSKNIIIVEPPVSVAENISLCKKRSEKNTTEPVAVEEEKEVKVGKKKYMDLTKLSLGQLRAEIKKKLITKKDKEAKRVALARVDENVCRSHAKGQQQNLNLQRY